MKITISEITPEENAALDYGRKDLSAKTELPILESNELYLAHRINTEILPQLQAVIHTSQVSELAKLWSSATVQQKEDIFTALTAVK